MLCLPCLHFSSFTAQSPPSARGSITLLAQFRAGQDYGCPSLSLSLSLSAQPFVVVYLFCKQFQHFVHSPSAHSALPSTHSPLPYTDTHTQRFQHSRTLHIVVACTCVVLMSFSICSMIRRQIDSHSISRRFACDNFDFYWSFLCTPISAILLFVPFRCSSFSLSFSPSSSISLSGSGKI